MALAALVPEPVTAQLTLLAPVVLTARVTVKVKALLPLFPSVWLALVAAIAKVGAVEAVPIFSDQPPAIVPASPPTSSTT